MASHRSSQSRDKSRQRGHYNESRKRYKYCCRVCKHTETGKKSCVCVVPMSQRRTQIGCKGCQTCGCKGCSIQDFLSRGQDPQYKPKFRDNDKASIQRQQRFDPKNGCCRKCMKAFSKTGKSCLCQVPKNVRMTNLPPQGCKICSCTGCNPRDFSESRSSRSPSRSQKQSQFERPQQIDQKEYNLNNLDSSFLGKVIILEYGLFPGMLGLGIPQRTPSYILGRPL